jgi:hypothetical protein
MNVGWSAHSTDTIANPFYRENCAATLDLSGFMSPDLIFCLGRVLLCRTDDQFVSLFAVGLIIH